MAGSANAAVFPEPVCDCPTTSRPESSAGIVSDWIGVASSNPIFATALSNSGDRPSSVNSFFCIRAFTLQTRRTPYISQQDFSDKVCGCW